MQLSTSTSATALESALPTLLPGVPSSDPGAAGTFADFLPAPAPAPAAFPAADVSLPSSDTTALPTTVPGGLVFAPRALVMPDAETRIPPAPTVPERSSRADASLGTPSAASAPSAEEPVAPRPGSLVSPQLPTSAASPSSRRDRSLPSSSGPVVRSARALPCAEVPAHETALAASSPAPIADAAALVLPFDLSTQPTAPVPKDETGECENADEAAPRTVGLKNPWLMPDSDASRVRIPMEPRTEDFSSPRSLDAATAEPCVSFPAAVEDAVEPHGVAPRPVVATLVDDRLANAAAAPTLIGPRAFAAPSRSPEFAAPRAFTPEPARAPLGSPVSSSTPDQNFPAATAVSAWSVPTAPRESASAPTSAPRVMPAPEPTPALPKVTALEDRVATAAGTHAPVVPAAPVAPASAEAALVPGDAVERMDAPEVTSRIAPRFGVRPEKFAAARPGFSAPTISAPEPANKNFLTSLDKDVTRGDSGLGTDVAKTGVTMSAPATSTRNDAATPAALAVHGGSASDAHSLPALPSSAAPATPAEISAVAHKAVDAVLASTERLTSASQSSVNLKFTVGGADLDVRVEVRAGAVHATFRTDSPELRTALAQEWQSTVAQPSDHALRLAAPVFTAGDRDASSAGAGSFGEHSSQARDQGARTSAEFVLPGSARARVPSGSPAHTDGVSSLPARSAPATTLHLHAFA